MKNGERALRHGFAYQENYAVPFIQISSDDTERKVLKVDRSAFSFMHGFANWIGADVVGMNRDYRFDDAANNEEVMVFDMKKLTPFSSLPSDPVFIPPDYPTSPVHNAETSLIH